MSWDAYNRVAPNLTPSLPSSAGREQIGAPLQVWAVPPVAHKNSCFGTQSSLWHHCITLANLKRECGHRGSIGELFGWLHRIGGLFGMLSVI